MSNVKKYAKIVVFDTLALLCFIGVALFGWIPGPGGIPLFILGLSLLAVNHDWAERWLNTAKHKGVTFKKWLFPDKIWVKNLYDAGAIILFAGSTSVLLNTSNRIIEAASVAFMMASLFVFLINRDRFDSFAYIFKRKRD